MLELKDVDFVRDGKLLLAGVTLTVGEGERWALLGPNGAGKSTLLSLCGAITHPTRGTVEIVGRRLGAVDIRWLRESIGHVNPRHPLRSPLTIHQVVLTGITGTIELMPRWQPTPVQDARARELIDLLGIGQLVDSSPPPPPTQPSSAPPACSPPAPPKTPSPPSSSRRPSTTPSTSTAPTAGGPPKQPANPLQ